MNQCVKHNLTEAQQPWVGGLPKLASGKEALCGGAEEEIVVSSEDKCS